MTRTELSNLYAFVNLNYSEDLDSLSELKKVLLLELKADQTLTISGKNWNKNDIISFFETSIDESFDYNQFIADYSWVENLKSLDSIVYDKRLLQVDFSDERFSQFAHNESAQFETGFLRKLKNYLTEQQDYYAVALLLYKNCFTAHFQLKIENEIKTSLRHRFNEVIALSQTKSQHQLLNKNASFFQRQGFYKLMKFVDDDTELTNLNLEALSAIIKGSDDWVLIRKIVTNQLTLQQRLDGYAYLNDLKEQCERVPMSSSEINMVTVVRVIIALIAILIVLNHFLS